MKPLSYGAFRRAATILSNAADAEVPIEALFAICAIESGPAGAFVSHQGKIRPVILFEAHKFYQHSGPTPYSKTHPWLSSKRWDRSLYTKVGNHDLMPGENVQWVRFLQAAALDRDAAIKSTSYGLFQILGENWEWLGYRNPYHFHRLMHLSGVHHLDAFITFIESAGLAKYLASGRMDGFFKRYNGPSYKLNKYDERFEQYRKRFKAAPTERKAYDDLMELLSRKAALLEGAEPVYDPEVEWYPDWQRGRFSLAEAGDWQ